jgi:hypothetical protein
VRLQILPRPMRQENRSCTADQGHRSEIPNHSTFVEKL